MGRVMDPVDENRALSRDFRHHRITVGPGVFRNLGPRQEQPDEGFDLSEGSPQAPDRLGKAL